MILPLVLLLAAIGWSVGRFWLEPSGSAGDRAASISEPAATALEASQMAIDAATAASDAAYDRISTSAEIVEYPDDVQAGDGGAAEAAPNAEQPATPE
jgi:hypothetical protein